MARSGTGAVEPVVVHDDDLAVCAQMHVQLDGVRAQLNGGAITLHSRRQPFYPGGFTPAQLDCFLNRMAQANVPVFLLDDGPAVQAALNRLQRAGQIRPVARLDVPLHKDGGSGQLYQLLPGDTHHCAAHANR